MATILDSFIASAESLAEVKKTTRLSETTLIKLFEINVGYSMQRGGENIQPEPEPQFTQADADAILAAELGINQEGPEANETLGAEEELPEVHVTNIDREEVTV